MKRKIFIHVVTFLFFALFLYTGIEKFISLGSFREQLDGSPLLNPLAGLLQWVIPVLECVAACIVIVPRWRLQGLVLSLCMMGAFTVYLLFIQGSAVTVGCSCGGFIEQLGSTQHLIFNSGFIGIGLLGIQLEKTKRIHQKKILCTQSSSLQGEENRGSRKTEKRVGNF